MLRRVLATVALCVAPLATALERWPAGAAFLFLAVILKAWPHIRSRRNAV